MHNLTPEQQKDVEARMEAFKKEYMELSRKHEVDFSSYPQFIQNPRGAFEIVSMMTLIDTKYAPIKSPLQPSDGSIIKS